MNPLPTTSAFPDWFIPDDTNHLASDMLSGGSDENLDAIKLRTAPVNTTNPNLTAHASCGMAVLATALHIEQRYAVELSLKTQTSQLAPAATTLPLSLYPTAEFVDAHALSNSAALVSQPEWKSCSAVEVEPHSSLAAFEPEMLAPIKSSLLEVPTPLSDVYSQPIQNTERYQQTVKDNAKDHSDDELTQPNLTFDGSSEADALMEVYLNSILEGSIVADAQGHWISEQPENWGEGLYQLNALQSSTSTLAPVSGQYMFEAAPVLFSEDLLIPENEFILLESEIEQGFTLPVEGLDIDLSEIVDTLPITLTETGFAWDRVRPVDVDLEFNSVVSLH